eukprot:1160010-Pelagomonas_calceolata.AAC.8
MQTCLPGTLGVGLATCMAGLDAAARLGPAAAAAGVRPASKQGAQAIAQVRLECGLQAHQVGIPSTACFGPAVKAQPRAKLDDWGLPYLRLRHGLPVSKISMRNAIVEELAA